MSVPFEVEELRENYYLVHAHQAGDRAQTRFFADPEVLDRLGLGGVPGADVARATVAYLLERQEFDDLPTQVDIEDVAAAYDDFEARLRQGLGVADA